MSAHDSAESDVHRDLLVLLIENVYMGVSNHGIVVRDQWFSAPEHLRVALGDLMERVVDDSVTAPGQISTRGLDTSQPRPTTPGQISTRGLDTSQPTSDTAPGQEGTNG